MAPLASPVQAGRGLFATSLGDNIVGMDNCIMFDD